LINTTIGAPLSASPGVASISNLDSGVRPFAVTMTPLSRKVSGYRGPRLEHAARIVAQVEHQSLERRAIALAQVFECASRSSPVVSLNWENSHIPHAGFEQLGSHAA